MKVCSFVAVIFLAVATLAMPASAAILRFDVGGDYQASWLYRDTISAFDSPVFTSGSFIIGPVSGIFQGAPASRVIVVLSTADGGGFLIGDPDTLDVSAYPTGPQIFTTTGILTNGGQARFDIGNYVFAYDFFTGPANYTLTIAAVPEPVSWAMLVIGFALSGAVLRRLRQTIAA